MIFEEEQGSCRGLELGWVCLKMCVVLISNVIEVMFEFTMVTGVMVFDPLGVNGDGEVMAELSGYMPRRS